MPLITANEPKDRSGEYQMRDGRWAVVREDRFGEFSGHVYQNTLKDRGKIYMHWDNNGVALNGEAEMDLIL